MNRIKTFINKSRDEKQKQQKKDVDDMEQPEEWKNDPLKQKFESVKKSSVGGEEESEAVHASIADQILLAGDDEAPRETPPDVFLPGSPNWKRREWALTVVASKSFNNFYTTLICLNAITLGCNADDIIPPTVSLVMESCFTVAYGAELYFRFYGSWGPAWWDVSFYMDGILWVIAACDLWLFMVLELFDVMKRPNLSVLMVLRLFRITRVVKAADKFAFIARPLRVLRRVFAHTLGLMTCVFGLGIGSAFASSVLMGTLLRSSELDVKKDYMNGMSDTFTTFCLILSSSQEWAETIAHPLRWEYPFAGVLFTICMYLIFIFCLVMLSALVVEEISTCGDQDDETQKITSIRDNMHIHELRHVLQKMDLKKDGDLDPGEVKKCYEDMEDLDKKVGLTQEECLNLLMEVDHDGNGSVPIQQFIRAMFLRKCKKLDVDSILFEETLRRCQWWSELGVKGARALQQGVCRTGAAAGENANGSTAAALGAMTASEEKEGVASLVKRLTTDVVAMQSTLDAKYCVFDDACNHLEGQLDHLLKVMNHIDWDNKNEAYEKSIPDDAIRLASLQFSMALDSFCKGMDEWTAATDAVEDAMAPLEDGQEI